MTTKTEIETRALELGGCAWTDREQTGTLADQIRAVAGTPSLGSDGDLTDDDRAALRALAVECEHGRG